MHTKNLKYKFGEPGGNWLYEYFSVVSGGKSREMPRLCPAVNRRERERERSKTLLVLLGGRGICREYYRFNLSFHWIKNKGEFCDKKIRVRVNSWLVNLCTYMFISVNILTCVSVCVTRLKCEDYFEWWVGKDLLGRRNDLWYYPSLMDHRFSRTPVLHGVS